MTEVRRRALIFPLIQSIFQRYDSSLCGIGMMSCLPHHETLPMQVPYALTA